MNNIKLMAKNIGFSVIAQIVSSILGFILLIYIARCLGEEEFGKYNFIISFTTLFLLLADPGISQYVIRELSRDKENVSVYLINTFLVRIVLSIISLILIAITVNFLKYQPETIYLIYIFGLYTILNSFTETIMSIFQALEKMEYSAALMSVQKIALVILTYYFLSYKNNIIMLSYSYIFSGLFGILIGLLIIMLKISKPKKEIPNYSMCKLLILKGAPFGLNTLFSVLFFKIDTIMLSSFKGDVPTGIYNAAYNPLLALTSVISNMFVSAIYPAMSKYYISSKDSLDTLYILSSKYVSVIGFPISAICFILSDRILYICYANQYSNSQIAFQILALFIPIRLASHIAGTLLSSINEQKARTLCVSYSAFFNIVLNMIAIPYLSYVGASISTVLSEFFLYILYIYCIDKRYKKLETYEYFIKPLISSVVMSIFIIYFKEMNMILLLLLASILYIVSLLSLKMFTEKEIKVFEMMIRRGLKGVPKNNKLRGQ